MPDIDILEPFRDFIEAGEEWITIIVEGPLKDFASNEPGITILRAIASSVTGGLAPILGPQLASLAFAIPGVVRGEDFDKAWISEFTWRIEKTAEILQVDGQKLMDEVKQATSELVRQAGESFPEVPVEEGVKRLGEEIKSLARRLRIREDSVAYAVALAQRTRLPIQERYDLLTGTRARVKSVREAMRIVLMTIPVGGSVRQFLPNPAAGGSVVKWLRSIP